MKIQFERLGPQETVAYGGRVYNNGDIVDMEEAYACAYLNAKLAIEVTDPARALARIKLEEKNAAAREKVKKDPKAKAELEANLQELASVSNKGVK